VNTLTARDQLGLVREVGWPKAKAELGQISRKVECCRKSGEEKCDGLLRRF
jgi:hypothetical protein